MPGADTAAGGTQPRFGRAHCRQAGDIFLGFHAKVAKTGNHFEPSSLPGWKWSGSIMQATTLTYLVLVGIASVSGNGARHKRVFSLFNVVTFKNGPCTSTTDSATKGTCLSNSDCVRQSGSTDGNCASGFGVCCVFAITGCNGDVKQ
eukprot:maker-scaffold77_size404793-snap-gene-3.33 protein:Tk04793 transcript:maker-scaffold77_size404793-snap-gene-3.33-mRNA-1 annotation:"hypothetical protein DAPPUDRAFT_311633"